VLRRIFLSRYAVGPVHEGNTEEEKKVLTYNVHGSAKKRAAV
jgi:hypothetical protein